MHNEKRTTGPVAAADQAVSLDGRKALLVRYALLGLLALVGAVLYAGFLTASPAHAQEGGDQIIQFLQNVQDWMVQVVVPVSGIGFLSCAILKSVAGSNENMHHAAHMGAKGSLTALGAGLMVGAFLGLVQGFVG